MRGGFIRSGFGVVEGFAGAGGARDERKEYDGRFWWEREGDEGW